ncbi:MAG: lysine--tRNA ligase, partial [Spirochaetales bacterium]|nr:lysine--tRNA ligase [Candidatus Physcosoma equi]
PEEFKFALQTENDALYQPTDNERKAIQDFAGYVEEHLDALSEKEFSNYIYQAAGDNGLENADFFRVIYTVLIGKEKGPKLAGFVKACGSEYILPILKRY